jgi:hypothetical protein
MNSGVCAKMKRNGHISKLIFIKLLVIVVLTAFGVSAFAQTQRPDRDVERRRFYQNEHTRRVSANRNIRRGWTKSQVIAALGQPERQMTVSENGTPVEIWGYEGFDVRIEFRNGVVSRKYFRFEK